jgi:hypothetical protein
MNDESEIQQMRVMPALDGTCACRSGRDPSICCQLADKTFFKKEFVVKKFTGTHFVVGGCYAKGLGNCQGKLTGEHYISKTLLKEIDQTIKLRGASFKIKNDEPIPIDRLKSKVLCKRHNSILSGFDIAGALFFKTLMGVQSEKKQGHILFNGSDVERWFLKTFFALGCSGIFSRKDGEPSVFNPDPRLLLCLFENEPLPESCGLLFTDLNGEVIQNIIQITPNSYPENHKKAGQLNGLTIIIGGACFSLILEKRAESTKEHFRPFGFYQKDKTFIEFSWNENRTQVILIDNKQFINV